MSSLRLAAAFLTRMPLSAPGTDVSALRRSLAWYPLVGLVVAAACVGLHRLALFVFPGITANLLGLLFLVVLKDAFHLDGLADLSDGLAGGRDPEERYRIMRDPAVGVMGALGVLAVLSLQGVVLLPAAPAAFRRMVLLAVPLSTAAGGLVLCVGEPRPASDGLGRTLGEETGRGVLMALLVGSLLVVALVDPLTGPALWGGTALGVLPAASFLRRRVGGVTGDGCGALIAVTQTALFLTLQGLHSAGWTGST